LRNLFVKVMKEKILFVIAMEMVTIIIFILVSLFKIAGRFKEKELEKFPRKEKNLFVFSNHPDSCEWLFIYNRFLRIYYTFMPWFFFSRTPYVVADKTNFDRPIIKWLRPRIITIDRNLSGEISEEEAIRSRAKSFKKIITVLAKGARVVGFLEGSRTSNTKEKLFSSEKNLPLGEINESLGVLIRKSGASLQIAGITYENTIISSLPEDGKFSVSRFKKWYKETLLGRNGNVSLVWGKRKYFRDDKKKAKEIVKEVEKYTLELLDMT